MKGKVSIIIPIYNSEKHLAKTLDSIVSQNYNNKELILIDDGSTDGSRTICKEYQKQHPEIILKSQNNYGAPIARNRGIEISTGEYIIFFDSDDIMAKGALKKMVAALEKEKSEIVIGETIKIDENNNLIGRKTNNPVVNVKNKSKEILLIDPFPGNKLYRKDIIIKNKITFSNVRIGQDLNFYLKYCAYVNKVSILKDIVSSYRITNNGISRTYSYKIFDIVDSLNDVESFYAKNHLLSEQSILIINSCKVFHFYSQLKKMPHFKSFKEKMIIKKYFSYHISKSINNSNIEKRDLKKLRLKILYLKTIGLIR